MKKLLQVALVVGVALTLLHATLPDCQASSASRHLLTVRIDEAGCVWWLERRASLENLPKPLFTDIDSCADSGCCLDYQNCYAVLEDYIGHYRSPHILVIVHPESHYLHFNNFMTVVVDIETQRMDRFDKLITDKQRLQAAATGEQEQQLYREKRQLEREKGRGPDVVIGWWAERDDRILQITAGSTGISAPLVGVVPKEHQFIEYRESGYWSERFPDSLVTWPLQPAPPKVYAPSPISEDMVVDSADSPATAPRHE